MKSGEYTGEWCPVCRSGNIAGFGITPESARGAMRPVECGDCGAGWNELLKVVGYDEDSLSPPYLVVREGVHRE